MRCDRYECLLSSGQRHFAQSSAWFAPLLVEMGNSLQVDAS
jgi:hypothetical protein